MCPVGAGHDDWETGNDDWGTGHNGSVQCRSRGFVSQVKVISVTGLRFWAERGRKSASGAF